MSSDQEILCVSTPSLENHDDDKTASKTKDKPTLYKRSSDDVTTRSLDSVKLYEQERGRRHDYNIPLTDDDSSILNDVRTSHSQSSISSFSRNLNDLDRSYPRKESSIESVKRLNDEDEDEVEWGKDSPSGAPPAYFELVARENTVFGDNFTMTTGMRDNDSLSKWPGDNQFYKQVQQGSLPSTITASTFEKPKPRPTYVRPTTPKPPPETPEPPPPARPPEEEEVPIGALLTDYTQNTTLHGLRFFTMQEGHCIRKVLWVLIILAAWAVFLYYSSGRIAYYLQYNKNVNVEVNYKPNISFPAVTICNQNTYRITAIAEHNWYTALRPLFAPPLEQDAIEYRECRDNEFKCDITTNPEKYKCVKKKVRCDMFPDCDDGTDEIDCDPCANVYVSPEDNIDWKELLPEVVGFNFVKQEFTYIPERPLYVRENDTVEIYIYYKEQKWWIGGLYDVDIERPLGFSDATASDPTRINKVWTFNTPDQSVEIGTFIMRCDHSYEEREGLGKPVNMSRVSRRTLITETSTIQNDFIEKCTWKGNTCGSSDVVPTFTNMGICFTFNWDPDNVKLIETAGPGNGLTMVINTEFYEYTKNADDGVGIKLLIHKPGDVAQVKERGVSVSPGLYSFVSVESTTVTNLEPPWGLCEEKDLLFYAPPYSVAKCKLECEAAFMKDQCGCRDFYHPPLNNDEHMCSVEKYIQCGVNSLKELSANPEACPCSTPCTETSYVPTTSFAVVLSSDSTDDMDQKTIELKNRLFAARETAQRVVQEKRNATERIFFVVQDSLEQMTRFLQATISSMRAEYRKMEQVASLLVSDCMWLRGLIVQLRDALHQQLVEPFLRYQRDYEHAVIYPFQRLVYVVNQALGDWPRRVVDEEEWLLHASEHNFTVWYLYRQARASAETVRAQLYPDVEGIVRAAEDPTILRFNKTMLINLLPYFSTVCPECSTNDGTGLVDVMKKKVLTFFDTTVEAIQEMPLYLDNLYKNYLRNMTSLSEDPDDQQAFNRIATSRMAQLRDVSNSFVVAIAEANAVPRFLDDFEQYIWHFQCQSETEIFLSDYNNDHDSMEQLLVQTKAGWDLKIEEWTTLQRMYVDSEDNTTLQGVGDSFAPEDLTIALAQNATRIDTITYRRQEDATKLQHHIASVNYIILAVTSQEVLRNSSIFWNYFNATSAVVFFPYTTHSEFNLPLPKLIYNISVDPLEAIYWSQIRRNLQRLKQNKEKQVNYVSTQLKTADNFFDEYSEGNELTADFYSKNYITIEMFYSEITSRSVSQQVAYSSDALLSECGGLMGLLMGASVISIFEVIDMALYYAVARCAAFYHQHKNRKQKAKQVHPNGDINRAPSTGKEASEIWATNG